MPRDTRPTLGLSLLVASTAALLACPQLLPDDFGAASTTGADGCARGPTCVDGAGGSSAGGSAAGSGASGDGGSGTGGSREGSSGSSSSGSSGSGSSGSGSSSSGSSGSGSSGSGSSGSGGSGGSGTPQVDPPDSSPDCWFIQLVDDNHVASGNCLGINGWNQVVTDLDTDSAVSLSYEDDSVCFTGTVVNQGWGAVFNLTLNDTLPWNGASRGVGGFRFEATGESLPPSMEVVYSDADDGDFCRVITPGAAVQVPFASAHPDCSTTSSSVSDAIDLTFIRLVMPPAASDYAVDYCLGIRAIP